MKLSPFHNFSSVRAQYILGKIWYSSFSDQGGGASLGLKKRNLKVRDDIYNI